MGTSTIEVEGGRIAYEVFGADNTPTVVAVPGIGDTRDSWRFLGPRLAEAGYRVLAIDLRGHGESDATFASYTTEDIGEDVVALLTQLDVRDAVLMGNSIGGGAIAHAALAAPDRVARLVMVNPFVRDMPNTWWLQLLVPVMFFPLWGVGLWSMYRKTLFKTVPEDFDGNHAGVIDNLREPGRLGAVHSMMAASKADLGARIHQLAVPTLVIMGSEDPDYPDPAAEGQALRELLGGPVEVAMVEKTGHYPQAERPDATLEPLLEYLRKANQEQAVGT